MFAGTINGHGALDGDGDPAPRRHHAGANRSPRRVRAGEARADAAVHRSLCRVVHAVDRRSWRCSWRPCRCGVRPAVRDVALSLAGPAGGVVPLRARDLDAGLDRVGARRRGAAGRAREGRHSPRTPRRCSRGCLRQDRHGDHRPPDARCGASGRWLHRRRSGQARGFGGIAVRTSDRRRDPRGRRGREASASKCRADVRALPGLGVEGRVEDAQIVCGTPRLFIERGR